MNESKLRKGTKYVSLKDEDVHTITGALKQFFRELKTELIPENIVKNLPNDLGETMLLFFAKFSYNVGSIKRISYIYKKKCSYNFCTSRK